MSVIVNSLPAPQDPPRPTRSIEESRVAYEGEPVAAFDDDIWSLRALPRSVEANSPPRLNHAGLGDPWGDVSRWMAYLWIHKQTPASLLLAAGSQRPTMASASTIRGRHVGLRRLLDFIASQGVTDLSDIDEDHFIAFVQHMREEGHSDWVIHTAVDAGVLWQAAAPDLPQHLRLPDDITIDSHVAKRSKVMKTRRIRPETIAPLVWWATRFIDDYADPIFDLCDYVATFPTPELDHPRSRPGGREAVRSVIESHDGLPVNRSGGPAHSYLSWLTGYNRPVLSMAVSQLDDLDDLPKVPPAVTLPNGDLPEGLAPGVDYNDLVPTKQHWPLLMKSLQVSSVILVAYLTGMRPNEVLRLKPGCVEHATLPSGTVRVLVRGSVIKGEAEADGALAGTRQERDAVWATVPVVARAIAVAERIRAAQHPDSPWLFPAQGSTTHMSGMRAGVAIAEFQEYVNEVLQPRVAESPHIPADTHGHISLRRFRRTLAWHIRNQPQGDVALGVQYQHVGTVVGAGYAARGDTEWAELLDDEGWKTRRRVVKHLTDELLAGAGISGPAAARAVGAAAEFDKAVAHHISDADLRTLMRSPQMQIYDNPLALTLCVHDPKKALCGRIRPGEIAEPDLLDCRTGCTNRATTDEHAARLRARAEENRQAAALAPEPLARRLERDADALEALAAQHDANRIIPTEPIDEDDQ